MAVIKFGSIVTDGAGSLGGSTIQKYSQGHIWRNKPNPIPSRSNAQYLIRSYNKKMQAGWRALSPGQRSIWNDFAHPSLSGHSLWLKYQYVYLSQGFSFQLDPSKAKLGPLGPEFILNGTFDNSDYWWVPVQWTISGGKANYLDTATTRIRQSVIVPAGLNCRLAFDVSGCPGVGKLGFYQSGVGWFLAAPYKYYNNIVNGSYSWDVVFDFSITLFEVWGNLVGTEYSLDNLSLKELLS